MKLNYNKEELYNKTSILLQEIKSIIAEFSSDNNQMSENLYFDLSSRDMFSEYLCEECIVIDISHNRTYCVISLCLAEESPFFNIETVSIPSEFQGKGYGTKIIQAICKFINKNNFEKYLIIADRSDEFIDNSGVCHSVWSKIFSKFPELEVEYL